MNMSKKIEKKAIEWCEETKVYKTTLNNGNVLTMRKAKGIDFLEAQEKSEGQTGAIVYWLASALCKINGNDLFFEDLTEMDLKDCMEIIGVVNEKNF